MKKTYMTPVATAESFEANEYVAACYSLSCSVGDNKTNPVDGTVWPSTESQAGVSHSNSGTGNCHDAGSNYLTTTDDGKLKALKEWRSDMNKFLSGSNITWVDLNDDGKCGGGDYFAWNTTASDGRVWHHWGIAQANDISNPNRS